MISTLCLRYMGLYLGPGSLSETQLGRASCLYRAVVRATLTDLDGVHTTLVCFDVLQLARPSGTTSKVYIYVLTAST